MSDSEEELTIAEPSVVTKYRTAGDIANTLTALASMTIMDSSNRNGKRVWKLDEFVAHGSAVNCAYIGRKSGRVMATGGEDRKVNIWAVGNPNAILSLSGHTSPVECVCFDSAEEVAAAGSTSGTLKLWDLDQAKVVRTLTGHKSSCTSLDFHPYGEFFASGSQDTNLKVWDIRRKGCIQTYKGHNDSINCIKFSPDGRWVISGSKDGVIKLWDLTAGKLIKDFQGHVGAISSLQFHPNEFLLASASLDKSVKFWDLETFEQVSSTAVDSIRTMTFHPLGNTLLTASPDNLRVFTWEPATCLETLPVNWQKVYDSNVVANQLVVASLEQNSVSVWVADLLRMKPYCGDDLPNVEASVSAGGVPERAVPKEESVKVPVEPPPVVLPPDDEMIFKKNSKIARSPTRPTNAKSPVNENAPKTSAATEEKRQFHVNKPVIHRPAQSAVKPASRLNAKADRKSVPKETPGEINVEMFLKKPKSLVDTNIQESKRDVSVNELSNLVDSQHNSIRTALSGRLDHLKAVRSHWKMGDTKDAVDVLFRINDQSVMVDVLNVLCLKPSLWNLDMCSKVLPHIFEIMDSKYDAYIVTSCSCTKLILKHFGPMITSTMDAPPHKGVDISREERLQKCEKCYECLLRIKALLSKMIRLSGDAGTSVRDLSKQFENVL
eukprot:Nk52_evm11s1073 gene=Nk52_evmTU11s1073